MAEGEPQSLAWKLNRLFETMRSKGGGEYSPEEVARAINDSGRGSISPAYIYMLRKGQRDNPTKRHLELLAGFFGVSPAYFLDEQASQRIEQQLELLAAFRDGEVRRLAARASGLSPASLTGLLQMVDAARAIEGLPPDEQRDATAQPDPEQPGPGPSDDHDPGQVASDDPGAG